MPTMSKKISINDQQVIFNLRREILLTPWLAILGFLGFSIFGLFLSSGSDDNVIDLSMFGALVLAVLIVPITTIGILVNRVVKLNRVRKTVPGARDYIGRTRMPLLLRVFSMIGISLVLLILVPITLNIGWALSDNW